VNLQVQLTGSEERARLPWALWPTSSAACCGSTSYNWRGGTTPVLDIACDDRGPVGAA